jgi:hypothetical protein
MIAPFSVAFAFTGRNLKLGSEIACAWPFYTAVDQKFDY